MVLGPKCRYFLVILISKFLQTGAINKEACDSTSASSDCRSKASNWEWITNACPSYPANHICSAYVGNSRVYMKTDDQTEVEKNVTSTIIQLQTIASWIKIMSIQQLVYVANVAEVRLSEHQIQLLNKFKRNHTLLDRCMEESNKFFCHVYFPKCEVYSGDKGYFIKRVPICRGACIHVRKTCAEELEFLPLFGKENTNTKVYDVDCHLYPKWNSKFSDLCIMPHQHNKGPSPTVKLTSASRKTSSSSSTFPQTTKATTTSVSTTLPKKTRQPSIKSTTAASTTQRSTSTTKKARTSDRTATKTPRAPLTRSTTSQKPKVPTTHHTLLQTSRAPLTTTNTKPNKQNTKNYTNSTTGVSVTTAPTLASKKPTRHPSQTDIAKNGKKTGKRNSEDQTDEKVMFYGIGAGGLLIIILAMVLVIYIKRNFLRRPPLKEDVESESPYDVRNFDGPDNIRELMESFHEEELSTSDENIPLNVPPPIPDTSQRLPIENVELLF